MACSCSGGDGEGLRMGLYRCPNCGQGMEIFSDEASVVCAQCGGTVNREELVACIDWCASARECLRGQMWQGPDMTGR